MGRLSVVLPAYNEEENITQLCEVLRTELTKAGISYELVLVDDGSTDLTWIEIQKMAAKDPNILGIHFSRNFGKEAAIYAGLAKTSGEAVAVMDCDLQHPPKTLVQMYQMHQEGYDVIEGVKSDRGRETFLHKTMARLFYHMMSRITGIDMQGASDFKLMDQKVVQAILSLPERNLFFRAVSSWVGYQTARITFDVQERNAGVSKWNTASLFGYAINSMASFTAAPLQIVTTAGGICLIFSILLAIYSLIMKFTGNAVAGYTTLLIVMLFIGSMVMISLGIIGYYISKIYEEVKHRPRYIIAAVTEDQRLSESVSPDCGRASGSGADAPSATGISGSGSFTATRS